MIPKIQWPIWVTAHFASKSWHTFSPSQTFSHIQGTFCFTSTARFVSHIHGTHTAHGTLDDCVSYRRQTFSHSRHTLFQTHSKHSLNDSFTIRFASCLCVSLECSGQTVWGSGLLVHVLNAEMSERSPKNYVDMPNPSCADRQFAKRIQNLKKDRSMKRIEAGSGRDAPKKCNR